MNKQYSSSFSNFEEKSQTVRCVVIYDGKFKMKEGKPASFNMHYEGYLKRYLDVFDHVTLISRLYKIEDNTALPVEGPSASFKELPMFGHELNYIMNIPCFLKCFWKELNTDKDVVVLRVPSLVGFWAYLVCCLKGIPFMVELAGDPAADFSSGVGQRQGFRKLFFSRLHKMAYVWPMRLLCKKALVSAYVTEKSLQGLYPPNRMALSSFYTTLNLYEHDCVECARKMSDFDKAEYHIVHVGMMQRLIKGQDVLIDAVRQLQAKGVKIKVTFVGDGDERPLIEDLVKAAGIDDICEFVGLLPAGKEVQAVLDKTDLFVLSSRQEGLPRALLEAMGRGVPCVASDVGGVSELLPDDMMVPPNNVDALVVKLENLFQNPERLAWASEENLHHVKNYLYDKVQARRVAAYKALKDIKAQKMKKIT